MDRFLKASRESFVATGGAKAGELILQMIKHFPKQSLHHVGIACFIGMGEPVATGHSGCSNGQQFGSMMAQSIAYIIQADAVSELSKQQGDYMAPGRKGS